MISEGEQSSSYACKIKLPGAIAATITSYNLVKDKSRSLQATILETESFEEAKKKYNELVNQLKSGKYSYPGSKTTFKWDVNYDKPDENKPFAASVFRPGILQENFKNLKLEVELHYLITSYTVNLFVYEKVEDDQVETVNIATE